MKPLGVQWRKLLIEGVVIVVSILLAFAIDAWWDERQEQRQARDQVARVVSELQANTKILENQISKLDFTTSVARSTMAKTRPDPARLSLEGLSEIFVGLLSSGTVSLPTSATNDFLSSGQLTDGPWAEIRYSLSQLVSFAEVMERASQELRDTRPGLLEVAGRHVPIIDVTVNHPLMGEYGTSDFSYDPTSLLADMDFQNEVAVYAVQMEINRSGYQALLADYRQVLADIEAARNQ